MSFTPKTRLEKILCGVVVTARTRIEKAVQTAMQALCGVLECEGTMATGDGDKGTLTLDVTGEELYAAVSSGKSLKVTFAAPGLETDITVVAPVTASVTDGGSGYGFSMWIGLTGSDVLYSMNHCGAGDTVALTEE